ncbi:MAG TPA: hypothetical protein VFQ38_05145 [Longimicrobiales bacterium]|nr:hypothetical protein [Longimicrobiales bacterium]
MKDGSRKTKRRIGIVIGAVGLMVLGGTVLAAARSGPEPVRAEVVRRVAPGDTLPLGSARGVLPATGMRVSGVPAASR